MMSLKDDKLKDLEFIKSFSRITVKKACEEEKIKMNNVYSLNISKENLQRIRKNIENKIKKLEENHENNTL